MHHFFQRGGDQAGQPDGIGVDFLGLGKNLLAGNHDTHIDHVEVVALKNDGYDVFSDIVDIAFHGGDHDFAFRLGTR